MLLCLQLWFLKLWQKSQQSHSNDKSNAEYIWWSRLLILGPYILTLKTVKNVQIDFSHLSSVCRLSVCCPSPTAPEASGSSRWTPCNAGRWWGRRLWRPPEANSPTRRVATTTSCPPGEATAAKKRVKHSKHSDPKESKAGGKEMGVRGRGEDGEVAAECGGRGEEMKRDPGFYQPGKQKEA